MTGRSVSRRAVLKTIGSIPALAASVRAAAAGDAPAAASPSNVQAAPLRTLAIVSRHLEWTGLQEGAEVAAEAGFRAVAWTCRPRAHILPENVERELPRAVEIARETGLATPMLITAINDVGAPRAEAILETMRQVGITLYRAPNYRYDLAKPLAPQFEAFKPRLAALAELNAKYGATAMFHTHSSQGSVGGGLWDLWLLVRDYPPNVLAINCDVGHATVRGGTEWMQTARFAHRHIAALSLKDMRWVTRADAPPDTYLWQHEFVVPGQGMVNFRDMFGYFKSVEFAGPLELYYEYTVDLGEGRSMNMLGNGIGWQLEMPKRRFISLLKRDVDFYRRICESIGWQVG
jgi:sugar phosphate isomerase/epimerase